ncbi:MAG: GNAT family N-acetyltransferase [Actinomycetota bacterium]|nr:GNAT family N-acetyltransferase [Actinomycetota bacterium]
MFDPRAVEIRTDRVLLRRFRHADLDAFVAYRSDESVARFQSWDQSYSKADAEEFLVDDSEVVPGQPGGWLQIAIEERGTGTLCGDCAVRVTTEQPRTAELGVTLAPHYQNHGIASEAVMATLEWLFDEQDMHRVYAQADDRNGAAHRLLERLGFRLEARLIEADWFDGEWTTLRIYAVLKKEWLELRKL